MPLEVWTGRLCQLILFSVHGIILHEGGAWGRRTKRKAVIGLALSVKQELFCLEYAKSGNARQAYKSAGYKCRSDDVVDAAASRLLSQVKVKERLAELAEEIKDNSIADIREMQETLTQIIRKQMKEEVIICDPVAGAQTMEKTPSVKEIISAITTLGKMQGAFVEKVEQTVDMDLNITVDYGDDSE